ncbi:PAS domain S-box protein [Leptospira kirschneri serovar Grippotyphosa str. Moskva]|nr:PAS domain S-box protein [Leptospira kirschneri serovar Grippotyphosa str. Moskva]
MEPNRTNFEHSQEIYEILVNQISDSMLVTDTQLESPGPKILFVNPAFCKMTGYTKEDLIGKTPRILQGPLTNRKIMRDLKQSLTQGKDFSGETINYKKDGSPYHVEWRISAIRDFSGNILCFISIQRDITEKVKKGESVTRHLRLEMGITSATQILLSTSVELKILKYAMEQFLVFLDSERLYLFKNSENADSAELLSGSERSFLRNLRNSGVRIHRLQSKLLPLEKSFFIRRLSAGKFIRVSRKRKKIFRSKGNLFRNFNPSICFRRMVWICRIREF